MFAFEQGPAEARPMRSKLPESHYTATGCKYKKIIDRLIEVMLLLFILEIITTKTNRQFSL